MGCLPRVSVTSAASVTAMSAVLIPATDHELRWVPIWVAVVYVVLAAVSWLDWRSSNR